MALKHCMLWLRPSRLLGFFYFSQLFLLLTLVWWDKWGRGWLILGFPSPDVTLDNWLFLAGIEAAVAGWVVTSFMTFRNSIKQHTINTLLQTRLSATYMAEANVINRNLFPPTLQNLTPLPIDFFHDEKNADTVRAVNYLINYFEFISVAIRHGDLDANVVKNTLRGILFNFYNRVELYIKYQRGEDEYGVDQPNHVEHYIWLVKKWKKQKAKEEQKRKKQRDITLLKRQAAGITLSTKPSPLGMVPMAKPNQEAKLPVVKKIVDCEALLIAGALGTAFGAMGSYIIAKKVTRSTMARKSLK